jgi:hypothetical protein
MIVVADVSVFTDYVKSVCDNYICVETTIYSLHCTYDGKWHFFGFTNDYNRVCRIGTYG